MNQVVAENKKLLSDIMVVKYVNYKLQEKMQKNKRTWNNIAAETT